MCLNCFWTPTHNKDVRVIVSIVQEGRHRYTANSGVPLRKRRHAADGLELSARSQVAAATSAGELISISMANNCKCKPRRPVAAGMRPRTSAVCSSEVSVETFHRTMTVHIQDVFPVLNVVLIVIRHMCHPSLHASLPGADHRFAPRAISCRLSERDSK